MKVPVRPSLLFLALALSFLAVACGDGEKTARGVITNVQAESILEWESVTLRTTDGTEITVNRGPGIDLRYWRASHLREHMLTGAPVTLTYNQSSGYLVATKITE